MSTLVGTVNPLELNLAHGPRLQRHSYDSSPYRVIFLEYSLRRLKTIAMMWKKRTSSPRRGLASHAFTRKGLAQTNPNGKHGWPRTAAIILTGLGLSRNYRDAIVPDSLGSGPAGEWIVDSTGTRTIHDEWTSPGLCWTINYFTTEEMLLLTQHRFR